MEHFKFHDDVPAYFVTFSVLHWLPVFTSLDTCLIITDSLMHCRQTKALRINAFVIMPTHLHLILFDEAMDTQRLADTISGFRRYTGRSLLDLIARTNLKPLQEAFHAPPRSDRQRQFWQQSRHPVGITSVDFWETKFAYIHDNPCRKGLVREPAHWRFSSAAFWFLDPPGETDVGLTEIPW